MRGNSGTLKTGTAIQPNPTHQTGVVATNMISGLLAIALPVVAVCAIVGYRKYRATLMQRRIKCLNHLWQLDSSEKLS